MKPKQPAVAGWFTFEDAAPRLIGSRCRACGTYAFPKESFFCRNPACASTELEEVPLSPRGRLWSYTNNCYAPPPPFVASEPFEPYALMSAATAAGSLAPSVKLVVLPNPRPRSAAAIWSTLRGSK